MKNEMTFWDDDFKGKAQGGYFVRNDLHLFFKKLRESGQKPVGIKVDDSFNLEVIVEVPEDSEKN